jgi:hypothetical protein
VDHNRTCIVSPYSPDYEPMEVPLVDAAVRYDRDGGVYILLIQNALYVPSLDHNLLPPFMMREAGMIVKKLRRFSLMIHRRRTMHSPSPRLVSESHCSFRESYHPCEQPKPTKGEYVTKEPNDADGNQAASDVTSKGRRQRNVLMERLFLRDLSCLSIPQRSTAKWRSTRA